MREIVVSKHYRLAETRAVGQRFYPTLLAWAQEALGDEDLVISFDEVEFVSPSFIDETLARLLEEHPAFAERLYLASVDAFTLRLLRSTLRARGIDRELPVYEPA